MFTTQRGVSHGHPGAGASSVAFLLRFICPDRPEVGPCLAVHLPGPPGGRSLPSTDIGYSRNVRWAAGGVEGSVNVMVAPTPAAWLPPRRGSMEKSGRMCGARRRDQIKEMRIRPEMEATQAAVVVWGRAASSRGWSLLVMESWNEGEGAGLLEGVGVDGCESDGLGWDEFSSKRSIQ